jgi:hypothetical protein
MAGTNAEAYNGIGGRESASMSLFQLNDIHVKTENPDGFDDFIAFKNKTKVLLAKNRERLKDKIPALVPGEDIRFVNGARWSAHDLLFHVLTITGPADVYITTWAISETAARLLHQAKQDGLVRNLHGVFDRRLPIRKPKVAQFIQSMCTASILVDCHAKMFVIKNESWSISCTMTCNYSNNRRIESGHISTSSEVADFDIQWITGLINGEDTFSWKR